MLTCPKKIDSTNHLSYLILKQNFKKSRMRRRWRDSRNWHRPGWLLHQNKEDGFHSRTRSCLCWTTPKYYNGLVRRKMAGWRTFQQIDRQVCRLHNGLVTEKQQTAASKISILSGLKSRNDVGFWSRVCWRHHSYRLFWSDQWKRRLPVFYATKIAAIVEKIEKSVSTIFWSVTDSWFQQWILRYKFDKSLPPQISATPLSFDSNKIYWALQSLLTTCDTKLAIRGLSSFSWRR